MRNRSLTLVVGTLAGLLAAIPALAQTTTKVCVPIPAQPGGVAGCQDVNATFPLPVTVGTGGGGGNPISPTNPLPVTQVPRTNVLVPLDVATVTTGATAVTALVAGNRVAGGWLQNPSTATINLCVNEIATASGTTSAGSTTCILPGQSYVLTAAAGAVSVVSSDSAHPFSGYGLK